MSEEIKLEGNKVTVGKNEIIITNEDRISRFMYKGKEYFINYQLADLLNSVAWNIKKDWDFVILVTGDRKVRVGKSVLALTIAAYLAVVISKLKSGGKVLNKDAFSENNIFFDNKEMIKAAQIMPPYSVIQYDEGREGLAASKAMKQFQQDLIDFFNECGQLNHIFIIVLPDFFELKENMAVARSEFLINVYRREVSKQMDIFRVGVKLPMTVLQRGFFEVFDRNRKSFLYDKAKSSQRKNYHHVKPIFNGSFTNQYTIDEEIYKQKKRSSLERFAERHKEENTVSALKRRTSIKDWAYDLFDSAFKPMDVWKKGNKIFQDMPAYQTIKTWKRDYQLIKLQAEDKAEIVGNSKDLPRKPALLGP